MVLEQLAMLSGALIIGCLGAIHLGLILFTRKFSPCNSSVQEAMSTTFPIITNETSMWSAWVGFNISHSVGALIFSLVYLPLTINYFEIVSNSFWLSVLPVPVSMVYLFLAIKYWFKVPALGFLLALISFLFSLVVMLCR